MWRPDEFPAVHGDWNAEYYGALPYNWQFSFEFKYEYADLGSGWKTMIDMRFKTELKIHPSIRPKDGHPDG